MHLAEGQMSRASYSLLKLSGDGVDNGRVGDCLHGCPQSTRKLGQLECRYGLGNREER